MLIYYSDTDIHYVLCCILMYICPSKAEIMHKYIQVNGSFLNVVSRPRFNALSNGAHLVFPCKVSPM